MAGKDIIRMSQEELRRLSVVKQVLGKYILQVEATDILGLCDRQIRRIVKRVREEGDRGVIHRSRGRVSNRRISHRIEKKVLDLCRTKYRGFNPAFASEKLFEMDKITIHPETLRLWFIGAEIEYKRRKGRKHRQWRERKSHFGEMIQIDGSHHDWFEGRAPKCVFMGYIDDATGNFFGRFYDYEGTKPALDSFKRYIKRYGIPQSVYLDKHTTYKSTKKLSPEEELENKRAMSQFERALKELGVKVMHAHSPQAKGRIERAFGTHQDRLVKEMRLRRISWTQEANKFLTSYYTPKHNRRFTLPAKNKADLHRPIPRGLTLDKILCIKKKAALRNDFTVIYDKKLYQVLDPVSAKEVVVEERINGRIFITYKDRNLRYKQISQRPTREKPKKAHGLKIRKVYIPPKDHPWRKLKIRSFSQSHTYQPKEKADQKEKELVPLTT